MAFHGGKASAPFSVESPLRRQTGWRRDERTLASLRKISDYPVYVLKYHGNYGFSEYLKIGERRMDGTAVPFIPEISADAWACTCFAAFGDPAKPLLGRNFDWYDDVPLVLFAKPEGGYASVSIVDLRYFGFDRKHLPDEVRDKARLHETPYSPFDGMNEKGVAVGMMAIPRSDPPFDPSKITLGELQVIRLILDHAASLGEAVALIGRFNVQVEDPPIHYLIADSSGHSAVIEFVSGKMIVLPNSEPWQVSTNFILHGSGAPLAAPCWRYNRAYGALKKLRGAAPVPQLLGILETVAQNNTIWSVLYDLAAGDVHLVPGKRFGEVLHFNLQEMAKDLRSP